MEAIFLVLYAHSTDQENSFQTTYEQGMQNVVVLHFACSTVIHNCPNEKQWAKRSCEASIPFRIQPIDVMYLL